MQYSLTVKGEYWAVREIIVAGAGTGQLTPEVQEAVNDADVIFCAERFTIMIPSGKRRMDIMNFNEIEHETGKILLLVSGDPGLFSLLPVIKRKFPDERITVLPGISSLQMICARACESWNDAAILSGHGRQLSPGVFLNTIERNRITILFCDKNISPSWACNSLCSIAGLDVFIGECLGTPEERVTSGTPEELCAREYMQPSIVLIRSNQPYTPVTLYPRDNDFIRAENIVMTHEAVRPVILSRLNLNSNSVLWDIGAGTGSISICSGLAFPFIDIHAVEYKPEAADVIARNAKKFHLHNINIHSSHALEVIDALPKPSSVFIGGSEGELPGILEYLSGLSVHVVIACVTLETFNTAYNIMRDWHNFEAVQVSISSSKYLTHTSTLMKPQAPVMVLSAEAE